MPRTGLIGEPSRLTPAALHANNPTWMPDSKEILFSARGSLWRLAVSGASPPARLPFVGEDGLMPVVSRPQPGRPPRLVYIRSYADYNIWRVETSAAGATASSPPLVAISSTRWDVIPQFSPDGRRVAFTSDRSGEAEIWLSDPDGSNAVQLTSMGATPRLPPLVSRRQADRVPLQSRRAGGGISDPLGGREASKSHLSPGHRCVPQLLPGRQVDLLQLEPNWRRPRHLEAAGIRRGSHTGDKQHRRLGHGVAGWRLHLLRRDWDRPSPVWRLPASGGIAVKVLEGVILSSFVVLEGGIYYIDRPSGEARLQYFDFATRRSRTVARNLGNVGLGLTASPDGRTILYSRMDSSVDDLMLVENFR